MIDLLYVAFNRLTYTRASFLALLVNTDWDEVRTLYVKDDGSTDGTAEWLQDEISKMEDMHVVYDGARSGGPVAATNAYLDWYEKNQDADVEIFGKIDNDFVVCPGWLPEMLRVTHLNPHLDVLGMEPMSGPAVPPPVEERSYRECSHIGGKGLIRHRVFERCRPRPFGINGYQGWTQYQTSHRDLVCGWITPDLPGFGLDQLPFAPWDKIAQDYTDKRVHRKWDPYLSDANMVTYWEWWT